MPPTFAESVGNFQLVRENCPDDYGLSIAMLPWLNFLSYRASHLLSLIILIRIQC